MLALSRLVEIVWLSIVNKSYLGIPFAYTGRTRRAGGMFCLTWENWTDEQGVIHYRRTLATKTIQIIDSAPLPMITTPISTTDAVSSTVSPIANSSSTVSMTTNPISTVSTTRRSELDEYQDGSESLAPDVERLQGSVWISAGLAIVAAVLVGGLFSLATIRFFEPEQLLGQDSTRATSGASGQQIASAPASDLSKKTMMIYAVQTGVYQNREAAEEIASGLRKRGYPVVLTVSNPVVIFAGVYTQRQQAVNSVNMLRASGQDAMLKARELDATVHLHQLLDVWQVELARLNVAADANGTLPQKGSVLLDAHKVYRMNETPSPDLSIQLDRIWQTISEAERRKQGSLLKEAQMQLAQMLIQRSR
jgi:hypothetical protein